MEATQNALHCQICAREIKAGNGKIAKHGYKVQYGSFTKSCSGTNFVPFEVSCERLEAYIETVKIWVINWTNELTALLENPPAVLTITVTRSGWTGPEDRTYEITDGFNVNDLYAYRVNTYGGAFKVKKSQLEQNIKYAKKDIEEMEARAAGWHKEHDAPALEVAPVQEEVTSQPAPVQEEETGAAAALVTWATLNPGRAAQFKEDLQNMYKEKKALAPVQEEVTSQPEAAALEASPIEVGDIVRPNTMYLHNAGWTRAKVIGLHYYDSVDGKWVIDIQYMRYDETGGLILTQTKAYMLPVWEVSLVERAAQPSDLDYVLEAIETRKREKIAALEGREWARLAEME